MSSYIDAVYNEFRVKIYNGNPLTEALAMPLDAKSFTRASRKRPEIDNDVNEWDNFSRKLVIETLGLNYLPEPAFLTLYECALRSILAGYLHRNPLSRQTRHDQFQIGNDSNYTVSNVSPLSQCIAMIGVSGRGKTSGILKALSQIPKVIRHQNFKGQTLRLDQVVWLAFEAPTTKTQKGFILNFFSAIDAVINTSYYDEWKHSNASVPVFIHEAKKVAYNHCVGIIFIDEIQRCAAESGKENMATLSFIDAFFDSLGIPAIIAGTHKSKPLFEHTVSTARRLTSGRNFLLEPFERDEPFWEMLINSFYYPQILKKSFSFTPEVVDIIHYLSAGLPAILCRLMKLSYEIAIESGVEKISCELLNDVYKSQFEVIHPALQLVRDNKYMHYEDLMKFKGFGFDAKNEIEKFHIAHIDTSEFEDSDEEQDEGLFIELPDEKKQTLIPADDYRNLKGLDTKTVGEALAKKKV